MNWKGILAVAAGVSVIAIPACMQSQAEDAALFAEVDAMTAQDALSERWTYEDQVDEMRGETTRIASIRAEGLMAFSPELFVARDREQHPVVGIRGSLDEPTAPQMRCIGGSLNVKFDDGPVREVECVMGMAVAIDPAIFGELQQSDNTWIEIGTSWGGSQQFKFKTANLEI